MVKLWSSHLSWSTGNSTNQQKCEEIHLTFIYVISYVFYHHDHDENLKINIYYYYNNSNLIQRIWSRWAALPAGADQIKREAKS